MYLEGRRMHTVACGEEECRTTSVCLHIALMDSHRRCGGSSLPEKSSSSQLNMVAGALGP